MTPQRLDAQIIALLDGDLMPGARERLHAELAADPAKAKAAAAWRALSDEWRGALAHPGAAYTFDALRARMRDLTPVEEVRLFLPRVRLDSPVPRLAVAAMFAAALGASWMTGKLSRAAGAGGVEQLHARSDHLDAALDAAADPQAAWPTDDTLG